MNERTYFETQAEAWQFALLLPKTRYTIEDYGKDDSNEKAPYFIEYSNTPTYEL